METKTLGVIKLGQLKRIQAVLHHNLKDENRFRNRNWKEEIAFIKGGRGQLIPSAIICAFKIDKSPNIYQQKILIENLLKSIFIIPYNSSKPK